MRDLIKKYEVPLSQMLMTFRSLAKYNDIPSPIRLYTSPLPHSTLYRIMRGFHGTFATGVARRQGTLSPPNTWSRPICDLHSVDAGAFVMGLSQISSLFSLYMLYLLRPILSRTCYYFPGLCYSNINK